MSKYFHANFYWIFLEFFLILKIVLHKFWKVLTKILHNVQSNILPFRHKFTLICKNYFSSSFYFLGTFINFLLTFRNFLGFFINFKNVCLISFFLLQIFSQILIIYKNFCLIFISFFKFYTTLFEFSSNLHFLKNFHFDIYEFLRKFFFFNSKSL